LFHGGAKQFGFLKTYEKIIIVSGVKINKGIRRVNGLINHVNSFAH